MIRAKIGEVMFTFDGSEWTDENRNPSSALNSITQAALDILSLEGEYFPYPMIESAKKAIEAMNGEIVEVVYPKSIPSMVY